MKAFLGITFEQRPEGREKVSHKVNCSFGENNKCRGHEVDVGWHVYRTSAKPLRLNWREQGERAGGEAREIRGGGSDCAGICGS